MTKIGRVTFLSSLGVGLEYYDFVIYGLLSAYLAPLFFKEDKGLLKVFLIFALGYFARPLGGVIFGVIGDRLGRKMSFVTIMLLMGCSTLLIGLLPTAAHIGVMAPIILVILRVIQGISIGAELPAAITIISEYNPRKRTGLHSSLVISSTGIGAGLASIVLMILTTYLDSEDMNLWGWRIPFILGGVLAIISYTIRRRLQETPAFQLIKEERKKTPFFSPILELFKNYRTEMLVCMVLNLHTSTLVIMNIYFSTYLKIFFEYSSSQIFQAMTLTLLGITPILVFLGWLGDRYNQENILYVSLLIFVIFGYFEFQLLYNQNFISLVGFLFFQQVFTCASISSTLPITAMIFPTQMRFTGLGVCYNLAYVMASLVPLLLTQIFTIYLNAMIVFYSLSFLSVIMIYVLIKFKKMLNHERWQNYEMGPSLHVS